MSEPARYEELVELGSALRRARAAMAEAVRVYHIAEGEVEAANQAVDKANRAFNYAMRTLHEDFPEIAT